MGHGTGATSLHYLLASDAIPQRNIRELKYSEDSILKYNQWYGPFDRIIKANQ